MTRRLQYTEDAIRELELIYLYIAEDNITAAERHRQRLDSCCDLLLDQPKMGRDRSDVRPGYRSVTVGEYVI